MDSDLANVSKILNDILNPDNKVRGEAAEKLEQLRKNTPGLLWCLAKILSGNYIN